MRNRRRLTAMWRAVHPSPSRLSTLAPASSSISTTPRWPLNAATCVARNSVCSSFFVWTTKMVDSSRAPRSIRRRAAASFPSAAATLEMKTNGVCVRVCVFVCVCEGEREVAQAAQTLSTSKRERERGRERLPRLLLTTSREVKRGAVVAGAVCTNLQANIHERVDQLRIVAADREVQQGVTLHRISLQYGTKVRVCECEYVDERHRESRNKRGRDILG